MTESTVPESVRDSFAALAGAGGWLRDLGADHLALYRPGGGTLLVEFEELADIHTRDGDLPRSDALHRRRDWATLTIVANGPTWFRDEAVHDLFDDLTDSGFFDDHDQIIFAGAGMCAYGAAAHSVAAPGATLFLMQPYATLDRDVTPWESRFRDARARAFGPRYGNAARMIDAAGRVHVVTDPLQPRDAAHASLFQGDHVVRLPAAHAGPDIRRQLDAIDVLDRLIAMAVGGTLTPARFSRLWRRRRTDRDWLIRFLRSLDGMQRPALMARAAAYVLRQVDDPAARVRLDRAREALARGSASQGPARRNPESAIAAEDEDQGLGFLLAGE
jgi:hypothetical protein